MFDPKAKKPCKSAKIWAIALPVLALVFAAVVLPNVEEDTSEEHTEQSELAYMELVPFIYDSIGHNDYSANTGYDYTQDFSDGLARIGIGRYYGFIDKNGNEVIPPIYNEVGRFYDGLARGRRDDKWGFIDKVGREVVPLVYSELRAFSDRFIAVSFSYWSTEENERIVKWGIISIIEKSELTRPVELSENSHISTIQNFENIIALIGGLTFVPRKVEKSFFEERVVPCITSQRDLEKMYAYYTLIGASDPDLSDEDRAELLAEYPNCDKVPIYVFDPEATDRERNLILGLWKLYTNLTNDDILQMYADYDIP